MTTLSDLIERTKRHLYSGETRDERNRLAAAIDADDTSLTFGFDLGGIARGAVLSVGLEEMYVWETSSTAATVSRGEAGTTAAAHDSGATVTVNPRFSPFAILQAVNEELADLSSPECGLFQVKRVSVTYQPNTGAYNLTGVTDLISVIDVTFEANDGTSTHPRVAEWDLRRGVPIADFASGMALHVQSYVDPGEAITVTYRSGFTALSSLSQSVESVAGVPATAVDIVSLGAAVRLLAGAEVSRNALEQGDTRRADELPPQARGSQARQLAALRRERISAEKARLLAQYPIRMRR